MSSDNKYAVIIGEVIVNECLDRGILINTSKLIKLLYFMQKLHIQKYGVPMFSDEFIATVNGPYIEEVANYFIEGRLGFDRGYEKRIVLMDSHEDVSNTVLNKYGPVNPSELMHLSQDDPLFKMVWNEGKGNNRTISFEIFNDINKESRPVTLHKKFNQQ